MYTVAQSIAQRHQARWIAALGYNMGRYAQLAALLMTFFVISPSAFANQSTNRSELSTEVLLKREQDQYMLEFRNVARRDVVDELFASIGAEVIWLDRTLADEHIAGRHTGSLEAIANRLLSNLSHTVVYDMAGAKSQISKVIIHGSDDRSGAASTTDLPVNLEWLGVSIADETSVNKSVCGDDHLTDLKNGISRKAGDASASDGTSSKDTEAQQWLSLDDGRLLIIEGTGCIDNQAGYPEIYDPESGDITITGAMAVKRTRYATHRLPDGDILVFGGEISGKFSGATELIERFDLSSETWSVVGNLSSRKHDVVSCPLADGSILIVGGQVQKNGGKLGRFVSAELFDPATGIARAPASKPNFAHRGAMIGVALPDGRCFIASEGPDLRVELYDPGTGTFSTISPPVGWKYSPTRKLSISVLPDGTLLYIGSTAMVFEPEVANFRIVP